jgi:hypothetical protein
MKTIFNNKHTRQETAGPGSKEQTMPQLLQQQGFVVSKRFALKGSQIFVDNVNERWALAPQECEQPEIHLFSDIVDCRLWESTTRAGTTMRINIILDDLSRPLLPVSVINYPVAKDSPVYKSRVNCAQDIVSTFLCMKDRSRREADANRGAGDISEEIRKLAGLADDGLITPEEFQDKKVELLKRM